MLTFNLVVVGSEASASEVDGIFHALADATRRDILRVVLVEERSISALARRYPMSFAAVHKHVTVLERAGLITRRRAGRESLARCNIDRVRDAQSALDALDQLWRERVAQIDQILAEDR